MISISSHQVCLELIEVDVEGAVKAKRGCDTRDNLGYEPVEVGVSWTFDVQVALADVVDGLVVHHEGAVGVLEGGVGAQGGVVGLHHGRRHLEERASQGKEYRKL